MIMLVTCFSDDIMWRKFQVWNQRHDDVTTRNETWRQRINNISELKIVSEYDQEIPQSQIADNPVAPRGRAAQPSRDTRKTN